MTPIPEGVYNIELEQHPNHSPTSFLATITDAADKDQIGKGFRYDVDTSEWQDRGTL